MERDALLAGSEVIVTGDGEELLLSALDLDTAGMQALQKLGGREVESVALLARPTDPELEENEGIWIEVALERTEQEERVGKMRGHRGGAGGGGSGTTSCSVSTHPAAQSMPQPVRAMDHQPQPIQSFSDEYRVLSNFWEVSVAYEGARYPTVEHAYVAAKTTDPALRREVAVLASAGKAKRYGKKKIQEREDWEQIKFQVMKELTRQKYTHPPLAEQLLDTGDALIEEGNPWHDQTWGNCTCNNQSGEHPECLAPDENRLGRLLMQVRSELRSRQQGANNSISPDLQH